MRYIYRTAHALACKHNCPKYEVRSGNSSARCNIFPWQKSKATKSRHVRWVSAFQSVIMPTTDPLHNGRSHGHESSWVKTGAGRWRNWPRIQEIDVATTLLPSACHMTSFKSDYIYCYKCIHSHIYARPPVVVRPKVCGRLTVGIGGLESRRGHGRSSLVFVVKAATWATSWITRSEESHSVCVCVCVCACVCDLETSTMKRIGPI